MGDTIGLCPSCSYEFNKHSTLEDKDGELAFVLCTLRELEKLNKRIAYLENAPPPLTSNKARRSLGRKGV